MNRGFTLIELLAVIIVLGVLTLITAISINPTLINSKESLTDIQIDNIKESASLYYIKHGVGLDDFELKNPKDCINVSELIESGYIENDEITNPKTGEKILGSVKVTYNSNNYKYEYQNNFCTNYDKGIICERVESTELGNIPEEKFAQGDAYNCKVDPNKEPYKFYILTNPEDGAETVNLIMDRNINSDGTPVTKAIKVSEKDQNGGIYNLVPWISKEDYNDDENYGINGSNNKGPLTAMNFLKEATKNWTNTKEMTIDSFTDDSGGTHRMKEYSTYARMPYYNEVGDVTSTNNFLYEYLDGTYWYYDEVLKPTNNINGIIGYWSLSINSNYPFSSVFLDCIGGINGAYVNDAVSFGVRPVISVYKFQME